MRYTQVRKDTKGNSFLVFVPPKDVRDAGICKSRTFRDKRTARFEIPRLIELVDKYRSGELREGNLSVNSKVTHLRNNYLNSQDFKRVAASSQKLYEQSLNKSCDHEVKGKPFGEYKVKELSVNLCRLWYESMVYTHGVAEANGCSRILSILFNYATRIELMQSNPVGKVRKVKHEPKSEVWTQRQVESFLEKAYESFETRNIGLIAHMCYEWAQRPTDIIHLKWNQFDWNEGFVTITQSKRGATVYLPLEQPLLSLLQQQKKDWDFQEWVVPNVKPSGTVYKPYNSVSHTFRKIADEVGLPKELNLGNLRKTGIMEMVEAGVDSTGIMQVSGHKSIESLNPYIKHTLSGAKSALKQRRNK